MTRQGEEKTNGRYHSLPGRVLRQQCPERGIDISKDSLDTFWLSKRKHKLFANDKAGVRALIRWVRQTEVPSVVFEATGVYHRLLEVSLAAHDLPFARVNPRQARRFAEGTGTLAKTDRVPSQ